MGMGDWQSWNIFNRSEKRVYWRRRLKKLCNNFLNRTTRLLGHKGVQNTSFNTLIIGLIFFSLSYDEMKEKSGKNVLQITQLSKNHETKTMRQPKYENVERKIRILMKNRWKREELKEKSRLMR